MRKGDQARRSTQPERPRAAAAPARAPNAERAPGAHPCSLWQGLVDGTWTLEAAAVYGGECVVVARANDAGAAQAQALTSRERCIVEAIVAGRTSKQVGYELDIAPSTVSTHLASALAKLHIATRVALIRLHPWLSQVSVARAGREPARGASALRGPSVDATSVEVDARSLVVARVPLDTQRLPTGLTAAERAVVEGVLQGRSNTDIARARATAPRTIANQLALVFQKLGVGSRGELVARFGSNVRDAAGTTAGSRGGGSATRVRGT